MFSGYLVRTDPPFQPENSFDMQYSKLPFTRAWTACTAYQAGVSVILLLLQFPDLCSL